MATRSYHLLTREELRKHFLSIVQFGVPPFLGDSEFESASAESLVIEMVANAHKNFYEENLQIALEDLSTRLKLHPVDISEEQLEDMSMAVAALMFKGGGVPEPIIQKLFIRKISRETWQVIDERIKTAKRVGIKGLK